MALTDAQKRAQKACRRKSVKQTTTRFYPSETDIWEWLNAQGKWLPMSVSTCSATKRQHAD